jgi:hypothetical protein
MFIGAGHYLYVGTATKQLHALYCSHFPCTTTFEASVVTHAKLVSECASLC